MIRLDLMSLEEAHTRTLQAIAALQANGELGQAIRQVTKLAHEYAVDNTHVQTGTLRGAHRIAFDDSIPQGEIYIDPNATNPKSGEYAAIYGPYEEERGGAHAFYGRVYNEHRDELGQDGIDIIVRGLPS